MKRFEAITITLLLLCMFANAEPRTWEEKTDTLIRQLVYEYRENPDLGRSFADSRNISLESDSVFLNIHLESSNVQLPKSQLRDLGVHSFVRHEDWASLLIPVLNVPEFSDIEGVAFIRGPFLSSPTEEISEGVSLSGADSFHDAGIDGQGATVAVIDFGFAGIQAAVAAGEFGPGPVGVVDEACTRNYASVPSQPGISAVDSVDNHGARVAQIVHDMAPGARLCLKLIDSRSLAQYQLALSDAASTAEAVNIVVGSINYLNGSYFDGTGEYSEAAADADNEGILYVASAGNERLRHWKSSVFETGQSMDKDNDLILEFSHSPFDESNSSLVITGPNIEIFIVANWDGWPETLLDYNLYLLKDEHCLDDFPSVAYLEENKVDASSLLQNPGSPMEYINYTVPFLGFGT